MVNGKHGVTAASAIAAHESIVETPPSAPPPPPEEDFEYFVSGSVKRLHKDLFEDMVDLLLAKGLFFSSDAERRKSPFAFKTPENLKKLVDFKLEKKGLLKADNPKGGHKELLKYMEQVIDYSPHVSHPFMVHKNAAGLDPYGIVGDWLSTTISQPVLTYFLSPVCTLMEAEVQERFRNLLGYPRNQGDGMVAPSHGMGNGLIIQVALQTKFPSLRNNGFIRIGKPRPAMFISELADYGFEKYCIWEGIGMEGCIRVKVDPSNGRMDVMDLKAKIKEAENSGFTPFMVVATAGTPVLGSIDPIDEIARVALEEKLWFHVDGHLAGSCVFSTKHKKRLKGIEKSDSCLWSPDKMLAAPFVMTIVVTKKSRKMKETFRYGAALVFSQDPFYNHEKYDNGDSTIQTTRRPDILKIWFMWKAKGQQGLSDQVKGTYENTAACIQEVMSRKGRFKLIMEKFDSNLVCFYYIPEVMRFTYPAGQTVQMLERYSVTEKIKAKLLKKGILQISTGTLPNRKDLPTFFIMNMNNTAVSKQDIKYVLDQIEYTGETMPMKIINEDDDETNKIHDHLTPLLPPSISKPPATLTPPKIPPPPPSYPAHVSAPIESMHKKMFQDYFKLVFKAATFYQDKRDSSPYNCQKPEDLLKKFDFSLNDTDDNEEERQKGGYKSVEALLEIIWSIINFSPHLGHPYFLFQLVSALDPFTMMADYIASCVSSPMYTYEDGPMYSCMEDALTKAVVKRVRFSDSEEAGGMTLVGGSVANEVAIFLAYHKKFTQAKNKGNSGSSGEGVIFASSAAHYATPKGAFFQGTGLNNCVLVDFDESTGRMNVKDLEAKVKAAIKSGKVPYMVVATAGTTVLGAYDPLVKIARICKNYDMFLHCDGAYGGSVIMSDEQYSRHVEGLNMVDSFTFNPHKAFGAARYTTTFVTKHKDILRAVAPPPSRQYFGNNSLLYNGELYDHGETHVLTDRRPDVFKMWLLWKAKGTGGLGKHVDKGFQLTAYAYQKLLELSKKSKHFQPILPTAPECESINFLYVPKEMQNMDQNSKEFKRKIGCVQNTILGMLLFNDKLVQSVEAVGNFPEHLIFCLYNSCLFKQDVDYLFKLVDYYGRNLNLDRVLEMCEEQASKIVVEKPVDNIVKVKF